MLTTSTLFAVNSLRKNLSRSEGGALLAWREEGVCPSDIFSLSLPALGLPTDDVINESYKKVIIIIIKRQFNFSDEVQL